MLTIYLIKYPEKNIYIIYFFIIFKKYIIYSFDNNENFSNVC